jgi:transposase
MPLRFVETDFAVDSSGFGISRFECWFNVRNVRHQRTRLWKKAHIMCGVNSNIITSVTITDGSANDSPYLGHLVRETSVFFRMNEVSGDRAYSSRQNMDLIASHGAVPYIPFRRNARRTPRGSRIWSRMFDYFMNNPERFLESYHRRSNVETAFQMIKRKFGNHLRTKNDKSQVNEILMKIICHNLAVLVQESFEQGLKIDFDSCAETYFAQNRD